MQKTLIDPFELALRMLPASPSPAPPKHSQVQVRQEEPVEARTEWNPVPRGEAWARVRCWCSED
jgi:hypothetical protein